MKTKTISLILAFAFLLLLQSQEVFARTPDSGKCWHHLYSEACDQVKSRNYLKSTELLNEALDSANGEFYQSIMSLDLLEEMYEEQGDYKSAEVILIKTIRILKKNDYRPRSLVGFVYLKLALVNYHMRNLHRASYFSQLAAPFLEKNEKDDKKDGEDLAAAFYDLGSLEYELKKFKEAELHLTEACKISAKAMGEYSLLFGLAANKLGYLNEHLDKETLARLWFSRSANALESSLGSQAFLTVAAKAKGNLYKRK